MRTAKEIERDIYIMHNSHDRLYTCNYAMKELRELEDELKKAKAKEAEEKVYAYTGNVIRLNDKDFDNLFHLVSDKISEAEFYKFLTRMDEFYFNEEEKGKGWFYRLKKVIEKKSQEPVFSS